MTKKLIAIGASTGGPDALKEVLQGFTLKTAGVIIALHMPGAFTTPFARQLNELCEIEVAEAADGDRIREGTALIAPGDHHIQVVRHQDNYIVELLDASTILSYRPSIDTLFFSVATAAGANAIGVIMTGMGNDGATGLLAMKMAGAATIAQDESSCCIFGMPKEAMALGAVDEVASLSQLHQTILKRL